MRRGVSLSISIAILATAGYFSWKLAFSTPQRVERPKDVAPPVDGRGEGPPASRPETRRVVTSEIPPPREATAPPDAIVGIVSDPTGAPIPEADVQIVHFEYQRASTRPADRRFEERVLASTVTDQRGRFSFPQLVPGELKNLRVSKAGFVTQVNSVRVPSVADYRLPYGVPVFGRVESTASEGPIAGVGVRGWFRIGEASGPRSFIWKEEVFSKEDGSFAFEGAPAGEVNFRLYHHEFMDLVEDRMVVAGAKNEMVFRMTPGYVIEGTVLAKGAPLAGADVAAKDNLIAPRWQARTDDQGKFRMRGVKPGTILFEIARRGFSPANQAVTIGAEHDCSARPGKRLEFTLAPAGRAAGTIRSFKGEPVAQARVFVAPVQGIFTLVRDPAAHGGSVRDGETRSGADGRYLVGDLVTGAHRIVVEAPGFAITASNAVSPGADEIVEDVDIVLGPAPTLRGTLTDERRAPVSNAAVTVVFPQFSEVWFPPGFDLGQKAERTVFSDDAGRFRFDLPYAGKYDVRVDHPDYVLVEGLEVPVGLEAEVVQDLELKAAHAIAGSVTLPSGAGAPDAIVTAWPEGGGREPVKARTEVSGRYKIGRLQAGLYRVRATSPGSGLTSEFRDEIPAPTEGVNFELTSGCEIVGAVVDNRGAPVTQFQVALRPWINRGALGPDAKRKPSVAGLEERTEEVSDEGGLFRIAGVDPATWTLQVTSGAHAPSTPVMVFAKGGTPVSAGTITLRVGGALAGRIAAPDGAPAEEVSVNLMRVGDVPGQPTGGAPIPQRPPVARTGPMGEYAARGLVPGEYLLRVESARFVDPPHERVVIEDGATVERSFTLRLAASITLEVRDEIQQLTPAVTVNVIDGAGRRVQAVSDGSSGQTTDHQGRITLRKLPAGEDLTFKLFRAGYLVVDVVKKLAEGENGVLSVRIQRNHGQ